MRRLTKAERARNDMWAKTMDNMSFKGRQALSHAGFAQTCQERVGYRGPDDGGEAYARVRDAHMLRIANLNWDHAIRWGIIAA